MVISHDREQVIDVMNEAGVGKPWITLVPEILLKGQLVYAFHSDGKGALYDNVQDSANPVETFSLPETAFMNLLLLAATPIDPDNPDPKFGSDILFFYQAEIITNKMDERSEEEVERVTKSIAERVKSKWEILSGSREESRGEQPSVENIRGRGYALRGPENSHPFNMEWYESVLLKVLAELE